MKISDFRVAVPALLLGVAACTGRDAGQVTRDTTRDTVTAAPATQPAAKPDLIELAEPLPHAIVASPLTVRGRARGPWFFEASFPVYLLDAEGDTVAVMPAQADGEWMTTEFVPFRATLTFVQPAGDSGILVLQKSNASGLPEHDDALRVPVRFH